MEDRDSHFNASRRTLLKSALASATMGGAGLSVGSSGVVTAAPATVSLDQLSGEPSFDVGVDKGFYLWKASDTFNLQWTGDTDETDNIYVVEFGVTTDGSLSLVDRESFNPTHDFILDETNSRIHGRAAVSTGFDGIDLEVTDATGLSVDLAFSEPTPLDEWLSLSSSERKSLVESKPTSRRPDLVNLGGDKTSPGGVPFVVTLDERRPGFVGNYYNLPRSHPDMQSDGTDRNQGLVQPTLPIRLTDRGREEIHQFDWWDDRYFSHFEVDGRLDFPSDFFPIPESKSGDPFHFAVHWTATAEIPEDGRYTFATASDDDSWVFIDGNLVVDNGGTHARQRREGTVDLSAGDHAVDIFFAERHTSGSNFMFESPSEVSFVTRFGEAEPGPDLSALLDDKRTLIDQIENLAAVPLGEDEAADRVDQRARDLVDRIDSQREDASVEEREQFQEAVERMVAAEDVSRVATSTMVGDNSPRTKALDNAFSLIQNVALELIPVVGGVAKDVLGSIVRSLSRKADEMLQATLGRGLFDDGFLAGIVDEVGRISDEFSGRYDEWYENQPDEHQEVVDAAKDAGKDEVQGRVLDAGAGLVSSLADAAGLVDAIDELFFELLYFGVELPDVHVPTPDDLELPDFDVSYDVPDEELPPWLRGLVPDEVELSVDPGRIDLPDDGFLAAVDDLAEVLETTAGPPAAIDRVLDDSIGTIDERLGGLVEQDDATRGSVRQDLVDSITEGAEFAKDAIGSLAFAEEILSLAEDLQLALLALTLLAAAALAPTGIGAAGALAVASIITTAMTVLSVIKILVDYVQVLVGMGYLAFVEVVHADGVHNLATTDLGGVSP